MTKVQKVDTKEFKEEAVKLMQSSRKSTAQVARDLGVSDNSLSNWQKQLAEKGTDAFLVPGIKARLKRKIGA